MMVVADLSTMNFRATTAFLHHPVVTKTLMVSHGRPRHYGQISSSLTAALKLNTLFTSTDFTTISDLASGSTSTTTTTTSCSSTMAGSILQGDVFPPGATISYASMAADGGDVLGGNPVSSLVHNAVDKFSSQLIAASDATADQAAAAAAAAAAKAAIATSPFNFQVPQLLTNIAVGLTAIIFLAAGLTYLTASILIPAGAQQLEQECLALIPDRWQEYQLKLEEGQSIKDRPDLMFELGLLLNGVKAENVRRISTTYYPDLWQKYQSMLEAGQELKDRPELVDQLSRELGKRSASQLRAKTPPELWEKYSAKASQTEAPPGSGMASQGQVMPLEDRADLLLELAQELGYPDIFEAAAAAAGNTRGGSTASERTAQAIVDAEIVSTSQDNNQWDD
eukprot:CAMPEP_0113467130 /NCGR_PEP_ID=MMETSP0014_2-20120614/14650_1 /TAXON_ID=2857 /ORGANISM="Nitzschia sp." /LENGTH=394 /DNA_ID=CAMNT_0000359417 /DNA_START=43 /DNA_END=1227 /DNA_ORIENTATION=+ /assembly_acc=CAM_ASM_000159